MKVKQISLLALQFPSFYHTITTHIVRAVVPLLPLHQDDLSHHQRGDEDQHHLCMHGLVTPVLHMQTLMLDPAKNKKKCEGEQEGKISKVENTRGIRVKGQKKDRRRGKCRI